MSARKEVASGKKKAAPPAPAPSGRGSPSDGPEPFVRSPQAYEQWQSTLPVLYDCFMHSNLEWPSYACAWGPVLPENPTPVPAAAKDKGDKDKDGATPAAPAVPHLTAAALEPKHYPTSYITQNFYFSRSTDSKLEKDKWLGSPNMLLKGEIYYPNQYRVQDISKMRNFDEDQRNPALVLRKKIVHPGEINRIKIVPQFPDLIATHTDSPLVYIWNTNTQPSRRSQLNTDPSVPDLTLQGHQESEDCSTLYYALDCSKQAPLVISGGSDQKICLWNIGDYCSTLSTSTAAGATPAAPKKHIDRLLSPRVIFSGHTAQVEEVCFHPSSGDLLCSVGDDRLLMVWDVRVGGARPVLKVATQHRDDVNAVTWNAVNENLLLTGSSDHTVKLIDLRRVTGTSSFLQSYAHQPAPFRAHASSAQSSPTVVETFHGHSGNVTNVQWHSDGLHFASGSDDGDLCVWSIQGVDALRTNFPATATNARDDQASPLPLDPATPASQLWDGTDGQPKHLLFRHTGHRTAVVNFAWNHFVKNGWNMASLSDDSADETLVGGGRLHVWRMTDLLSNPFPKVVDEFAGGSGAAAAAASALPVPSPAASPTTSDVAPMDIDDSPAPSTEINAAIAAAAAASSLPNSSAESVAVDMPPPDNALLRSATSSPQPTTNEMEE